MKKPNPLRLAWPGIGTRLTAREIARLARALREAGTLSMGPRLQSFETHFSVTVGGRPCLGVNSGTAALELAALLLNLHPGDEVIVPAHTFTASALPFARAGAKLVFADSDPATFVLDPASVAARLTRRTRAVVAVHLYGLMCDVAALRSLCRPRGIALIEDCAQSPGAEDRGRRAGTAGDFGCFSFHAQKNISTLGEGGMLVCRRRRDYRSALALRKIGARPFPRQRRYWLPAMTNIVGVRPGLWPHNFALPELNALAGDLLLARLDGIRARRERLALRIRAGLADRPELRFQAVPAGQRPAWHLLVARYDGPRGRSRDDLIGLLHDRYRIKCAIQYRPLYQYDLFRMNGYRRATCPRADDFFAHMISFPFWTEMTGAEADYLVDSVRAAVVRLRR